MFESHTKKWFRQQEPSEFVHLKVAAFESYRTRIDAESRITDLQATSHFGAVALHNCALRIIGVLQRIA